MDREIKQRESIEENENTSLNDIQKRQQKILSGDQRTQISQGILTTCESEEGIELPTGRACMNG